MDSLPFTMVDVGVGAVVAMSAIFAYGRGFVREVLSVAGWVGAIFATIYGFPYVKPYARELISIGIVADLAAGVTSFIVSLVVLSWLTRGIANWVRASSLSLLDRSLGLLFGVLRGAVLVSLAYLAFAWVTPPDEQSEWLRSARTMPYVEAGAALLRSLVPEDTAEASGEAAGQAQKKVRQVLETQKMLRDILNPEPRSEDPDRPAGYNWQERRDMERLIDTNR